MATRTRSPYRSVGFVLKHNQPLAAELASELAKLCLDRGARVVFCDESKNEFRGIKSLLKAPASRLAIVPKPKLVDKTDLILVLGGDGTLLSIARLMRTKSVPVMGINLGTLGFLTEVKRTEAHAILSALLDGAKLPTSERALLEVTLKRQNKTIFQGPVINDAVISKGAIARIIGMQIEIDERPVSQMRADGLIVSTPTGSTAYSLAAGGPIVEPTLQALILAPICPHSLNQRPLVVSDQSEIRIRLSHGPGHVVLTLDGQDVVDMKEGDVVTVRRFKRHALKLLSSPTRDYFSLLREKLQYGSRV